MQSLADFLGARPTGPEPEGEAAPRKSLSSMSARAICRAILSSDEYRKSLLDRITLGELAPAVECRLWDYGYGKPVDRVEVKDTTQRFAQLSAEELEARALHLAQLARQVRETQDGALQEDSNTTDSIH